MQNELNLIWQDRKEFAVSRHVPYGKASEFKKCISEADVPKLVRLVKIVGMLLQAKVYLLWSDFLPQVKHVPPPAISQELIENRSKTVTWSI